MKISIKHTLILAFAALSLAVIGLVGRLLLQEVAVYRSSTELSQLAQLDARLFDALLGLRGERGAASSASKLEPADIQSSLTNLQEGRKAVDPAFDAVKALSEEIGSDELSRSIVPLMDAYGRWVSFRSQIDAAFQKPVASRDPDLTKQVLALADQMLADLEAASNAVEVVIAARNPQLMMFTQLRALGWSMRTYGGSANSTLVGAIIAKEPLTAAKLSEIAVHDGKVGFAWNLVSQIVKGPSVPASIVEQYKVAESTYFGGAYAEQKAAALAAFEAGQPMDMAVDAWRKPAAPAQASLADIAQKSLDQMNVVTAANVASSTQSILIYGVAMVMTLALSIAGILMVIFRIANPIAQLTSVMRKLAGGDLAVAVPASGRSDEIGEMARAVEVFKEAALHNKTLEAEAEESRKMAEVERIAFQEKAEREAEERLTQATSGLARGLQALASGNLACEINEVFSAQFESLRHDFNSSVRQLRDALEGVSQSALSVRSGSGEISMASDQLSKRTEQQAASLEETAAALEEVTTNVKQTSERASEAREIVRHASTRASSSSEVVSNAVEAMKKIEMASSQITNIIGVIDEIAFQTNLLALNAGVEAARAGDAGKGFAVVAQEVRELAQRSANAAKEIKLLIGNSEAAVTQGVNLVNDTGAGLSEIADLVTAINQHMEAIATAAKEQASGLSEINTSVNHMDQMTQQNAAMVEEMNAAGATLAQESARLSQLLERFEMRGAGSAGTASRQPGRRQAA
ncbi:methyl-accepting chemotaxis protein [Rhizobium sp. AAP43]|uniref:methyl-accepting chemotaxis protein n=1 Tax=Rhizobium sp. AAP43 TaxID=1523420 RepID=UPI0006B88942|nr:HAMP domain-containing methyl-accepting chemotaxis protein [Rhizobium sp. AAP43]KPF45123.1 chemotaxis protein [Rhizobium sp. AAP43]